VAFDAHGTGPSSGRLETLPDDVVASLEVRDAWRRQVASSGGGLEFIVDDLARWPPGSDVRVAFLGGNATLHSDIEQATRQITDACNLGLDFGRDPGTGEYRRWTEDDTTYAAEIRVSFDMDGFFSLIGTDSSDPTIGAPGRPIGGRPGQRSLNLEGFETDRPDDWEGTVRHEFLHALAFKHAHQNLRGPCENEFRWDDDPGYVPTRDARGRFIRDAAGRFPGIYTFLAGPPNNWPRGVVDHNLRRVDTADTVAGPFDPASVMLYAFEPFFYKSNPSACAPTGNGIDLSNGDRRGLQLLYPGTGPELSNLSARAGQALQRMDGGGLEAAMGAESSAASPDQQRVLGLLDAFAGG
jgi:hypothetical protein